MFVFNLLYVQEIDFGFLLVINNRIYLLRVMIQVLLFLSYHVNVFHLPCFHITVTILKIMLIIVIIYVRKKILFFIILLLVLVVIHHPVV